MNNTTIIISNYMNSYASLNGSKQTKISKFDIARGILSIGKTHWTQYIKSSRRTLNDFLHHWTGLVPFINERPDLVINSNYASLDLSDKILKSYHIGMGVSKIVAERVLKIPYLQHVDSLVQQGVITLTAGTNERGDMVGLDKQRNWHVMEAKGRTSVPSNADKLKAKTQAQRITSISGITPATKSYCITHINDTFSEIFLNDPDDKPVKPTELKIATNDFIKIYYDKIFKEIYGQKNNMVLSFTELNIEFSLFRIDNKNSSIYVGLENRILNDLRKDTTSFTETLFAQSVIFDRFTELNIDNLSIGNDGIVLFEDIANQIGGRKTAANISIAASGAGLLNFS
jgi:hypothetical protein